MTTDAPLLLGRDGAVATIRFNRPAALNAISVPMANAFLAAARELAADKGVRAVLLSGAGKGFMAGGDLAVLKADPLQGAADLIGPLTMNPTVANLRRLIFVQPARCRVRPAPPSAPSAARLKDVPLGTQLATTAVKAAIERSGVARRCDRPRRAGQRDSHRREATPT
jgi:hypothetical protein